MALNIDFNDPDAWDDNALVDTWNEAFEEYKKFHSIHASGKKLVDVLTKEELDELQRRGIQIHKKRPRENAENDDEEEEDEEEEMEEQYDEEEFEPEDPSMNGNEDASSGSKLNAKGSTKSATNPPAHQIPDALLNSVPDESLKNLMMSWYWAGYYTGFHQGQTAARSGNS